MSIYCQFRSEKERFYYVPCDDINLSYAELKQEIFRIMKWDKLKKRTFDLILQDAATLENYGPEDLIRRNASVTLIRVPLEVQPKKKSYIKEFPTPVHKPSETFSQQPSNLVHMKCSEEEKVDLMMSQSCHSYDPSNYVKVPSKRSGKLPPSYTCYRCHQKGHWSSECTFTINGKPAVIKKAYGIPRTMTRVVKGPEVPGAMVSPTGEYVVYAPEQMLMMEECGKPKMPLPISDLKSLPETVNIKEETGIKQEKTEEASSPLSSGVEDPASLPLSSGVEDPTSSPISSGVEDLTSSPLSSGIKDPTSSPLSSGIKDPTSSPLSSGIKDPASYDFSPSNELSDSPSWSYQSNYPGGCYQQLSSDEQYWYGNGSSYQQPVGYDQWGSNYERYSYHYQGKKYYYQGYSQTGYQQWPQQQYFNYDQPNSTQSEVVHKPVTEFSQYSEPGNFRDSNTRRYHSSRRSEGHKSDSRNRYQESRYHDNKSAKKIRHSYSKRDHEYR